MPRLSFRLIVGILSAGLISAFCPSCYHFRVTSHEDVPLAEFQATRWCFLWGIFESPIELAARHDDPRFRCESGRLRETSVKTNFGYALLTVLSLGTIVPADVTWSCATPSDILDDTDPGATGAGGQ